MKVLSCGPNALNISGISDAISPRYIRKNPRSIVHACVAHDGAICSKNRNIVPYHRDSPNTRNGARLRSPSPIMAPGWHCAKIASKTSLSVACSARVNGPAVLRTL